MWIPLTISSLKTALSAPEIEALPTVARDLDYEPEDLLDAAISEVMREIRGHVGARNSLGPVGTIPDELEGAALSLIRRRVFGRLPGTAFLFDEVRKQEANDAQALLRLVAKGNFVVVASEESASAQPVSQTPKINSRPRRFTHSTEDGV